MNRWLNFIIKSLCVVGLLLSATSTYNHYVISKTEYCDINATFNCDIVNRSSYSEILHVPVAVIGILGYSMLLCISIWGNTSSFRRLRCIAAFGGLAFGLYLAYVEEHILHAWCILCIGSLLSITLICAAAALSIRDGRPDSCCAQLHD